MATKVKKCTEKIWPTPVASDGSCGAIISKDDKYIKLKSGRMRKINRNGTDGSLGLARTVSFEEKIWPTPCSNCGTGACEHGAGGVDLQTSVKFPTPCASEARQGLQIRQNGKKGTQQSLSTIVKTSFPTPTNSMMTVGNMEQARFCGNGGKRPEYEKVNSFPIYGTPKATQSVRSKEFCKGRMPNMAETAKSNGGQLNPDWVEWLMGWPVGWSRSSQLINKKGGCNAWRELNVDPADNPGDIPRITSEKKDRCNRLKAIGNGQVPLCKAIAMLTLAVALNSYQLPVNSKHNG